MIYVTHDQVEAMTLADRIVVLEAGRIAQVGTPKELYKNPQNLFVAGFIGSPKMNFLPCKTEGGRFVLDGGGSGPFGAGGAAVKLGIRPEHITLTAPGGGLLDGVVDVVEYLGADTFLIVDCGESGKVTVRATGETAHQYGDKVGLGFQPEDAHFFREDGQAAH